MSKVICDVCGTTYPETAAQCPICNSAKSTAEQTVAADGVTAVDGDYAYVKGGRFSKKNVRKRNKKGSTAQRRSAQSPDDEPSNAGLIVVVVLLLIAIVAVVIYIGVRYFGSSSAGNNPDSTKDTQSQTQTQTPPQTSDNTELRVPCEQLQLSNKILEFGTEGETWTLVVAVNPVDTTDKVTFVSSDEAVATVTDGGVITAVGGGEATITVTCGDAVETCSVKCSFGETTPPTTQPSEPPVTGEFEFSWNTSFKDKQTGYGDATLSAQGKTWKAYKSSLKVDPKDITWSSDDTNVCTVVDGIVTAVGHGRTLIHASYNGVTYSCIIRCSFPETAGNGSTGGDDDSTADTCTISHTDVTIAVGETFVLTLKNSSGKILDVEWKVSEEGHVTIDNNRITGSASGTVKVSVTYEDKTYTCIVRVTQ